MLFDHKLKKLAFEFRKRKISSAELISQFHNLSENIAIKETEDFFKILNATPDELQVQSDSKITKRFTKAFNKTLRLFQYGSSGSSYSVSDNQEYQLVSGSNSKFTQDLDGITLAKLLQNLRIDKECKTVIVKTIANNLLKYFKDIVKHYKSSGDENYKEIYEFIGLINAIRFNDDLCSKIYQSTKNQEDLQDIQNELIRFLSKNQNYEILLELITLYVELCDLYSKNTNKSNEL